PFPENTQLFSSVSSAENEFPIHLKLSRHIRSLCYLPPHRSLHLQPAIFWMHNIENQHDFPSCTYHDGNPSKADHHIQPLTKAEPPESLLSKTSTLVHC